MYTQPLPLAATNDSSAQRRRARAALEAAAQEGLALRRAATSSGFSGVVYNRILPKVVLGRRLPSHTVFECPTPRVSAHSYIRLYSSCSTTPYSWSSAEEAAHWSAPSCSVRAITNIVVSLLRHATQILTTLPVPPFVRDWVGAFGDRSRARERRA